MTDDVFDFAIGLEDNQLRILMAEGKTARAIPAHFNRTTRAMTETSRFAARPRILADDVVLRSSAGKAKLL
jgi:hypothetical protein